MSLKLEARIRGQHSHDVFLLGCSGSSSKVGFDRVNQHVKHAMIQWIGVVVKEKFQRLVDAADREDVFSV